MKKLIIHNSFINKVGKNLKIKECLVLVKQLTSQLEDFSSITIFNVIEKVSRSKEVKFGDLCQVVRLSATGKLQGADLFKTLILIGKEKFLSRMDRAINIANRY